MSKSSLRVSDKHRTAIKADGTRLPVLDGPFDFLIEPNEEEIRNGIRGDPTQCMLAQACRRINGCDLVWVCRYVAYMEMKAKGGRPVLYRFILSEPAKSNVKDFDTGANIKPEAVIFAKPRGRQRLDAMREQYKATAGTRKTKKEKAFVTGKGGVRKKQDHSIHPWNNLRAAATGKFQFPTVLKSI
jgi:hypothetical protein